MKMFCIIFLGLLTASGVTAQTKEPCSTCLPEGITFHTQAQIDDFQTNYPGCTEIEGNVYIEGNDITNLNGLSVLTYIAGTLTFYASWSLSSLTGLEGLTAIGEHLEIMTTDISSMAGLDNLTNVGGHLQIFENYSLTSLTGLDNLTSIGLGLGICYNNSLTDLTGLEGLTSIGEDLAIWQEASLTSLSGLQNVTSIGGDLYLYDDPYLESLTGLDNINAATIIDLSITNNPSLSTCEVQCICDYLASPGGTVEIHDNATGCNSQAEVEAACGSQSCLPEGITFTTQAQIDNFQIDYPGCTEIEGNVIIYDNWTGNINNLNGLSVLTSIGSSLSINYNLALTGLTGLDNLISIGESLSIWQNPALTNISGIQNLTTIGGDLVICANANLTSLNGLSNLTSLSGKLLIGGGHLTNLAGLEGLTSVGGDGIYISEPYITSLAGLDNIDSVSGCVIIQGDSLLPNLTGLNNLTYIGGYLLIGWDGDTGGNCTLDSLTGLEGLTHVGGDILIKGNHALTSLNGLNNVNTVNGIAIINNSTLTSLSGLENILSNSHLSISNNPSLTSLAGLANLITVGGFYIVDNASLNTLIGLSSLDSVARLYIENNDSLPGLIGLDSIAARSVEEITIIFNDSLSSCAVQSICEYLASPNGTIEIHDNAPGCNSPEEVEAACETIGLAEIISDMGFNVYPNPSSDNVFFSFTLIESSEVKLEIHNNMGQIVSVMNKSFSQGGQQVVWDAENMPTGLYFYRLIKDKQPTSTGKLMVVR